MTRPQMTRLQIFLPEAMLAQLKVLSDSTGIKWQEHLRAAVHRYLKEQQELPSSQP